MVTDGKKRQYLLICLSRTAFPDDLAAVHLAFAVSFPGLLPELGEGEVKQ